mmetsp:Transcript_11733/g.15466  ORF Transcript_11733/g.15466 Transcript_11733/m.15466 type:complete len:130 (-) Transcript_11733:343-732(-)
MSDTSTKQLTEAQARAFSALKKQQERAIVEQRLRLAKNLNDSDSRIDSGKDMFDMFDWSSSHKRKTFGASNHDRSTSSHNTPSMGSLSSSTRSYRDRSINKDSSASLKNSMFSWSSHRRKIKFEDIENE